MKPRTKELSRLLKNVDSVSRFPTERKHLTMEEKAARAHLGEPKTVTVRIEGDWP